MADDDVVLHERLKQLNEYISDLRELQKIDFRFYTKKRSSLMIYFPH